MTAPLLSVSQLSLIHDKGSLFKNIAFEVNAGEILAVMGPSGIGKSMMSKAIAGFLPKGIQPQGEIRIAGNEVAQINLLKRTPEQRAAVIFQDPLQALNPLARIGTQLSLALSAGNSKKGSGKDVICSLLSQLGFEQPEQTLKHYPSQLSGGQRQRICIAMALLGSAQVLIADEPTSALDPVTEREILDLLRSSIKQQGIAGVLITHDLHSALACDKLVVIDEGQMVAYGKPQQALLQSQHPFCHQLRQLMV
ncbi:ABC transporter ATP-binding protein [Photobacterium rosenbergii]|uniref:ABC transporter ATP-binding protein n=1 Tax=Photobacterium rosenbergii TaxID=294936 RepID=A0A2T3NM28_9GAMM|nr:ATP-binding cassette domain-containing protein [Photobacterium rosenbergii]PSW16577.1 ABC transporter ATP-binding protein [Photobacterium rosenbergii]